MRRLFSALLLLLPGLALADTVAVCTLSNPTLPLARFSCPDVNIVYVAPAAGQLIDTITDTSLPQSSEKWVLSDTAADSLYVWAQPSGWALKSSLGFPVPAGNGSTSGSVALSDGTAIITWSAVTTDTTGATATITGYNVYQGTSTSTLKKIGMATSPTYTVNGLAAGTYYFAVTAVSAAGESSQMVSPAGVVPSAVTPTPALPAKPASITVTITVKE